MGEEENRRTLYYLKKSSPPVIIMKKYYSILNMCNYSNRINMNLLRYIKKCY